MKRNFPNRNHWRAFYLFRLAVLVLFTAIPARGDLLQQPGTFVPAAVTQPARKPGTLNMRLEHGRVTATNADRLWQITLRKLSRLMKA